MLRFPRAFEILCVSALALFASSPSFALPSLQPKLRDKEIRVSLLGNTYLTKTNEQISDSRTGNLQLNVGVRAMGEEKDLRFGIEGEATYGVGAASISYVNLAEGYVGYQPGNFSVFTGRKKYSWSNLDSYWGLGLFQPRFRWDYLNEKENGLAGLFTSYQTETFSAVAYYSPIFVPEQGAPFDISNNACKTSSPWFSCPSSTVFLFNQPTDVNLILDIPPIRDLISHSAYGATFRAGRDLGPFARVSYTHKPINQFLLSFEGRLSNSLSIPAVIRPRVLYHDLYAADAGWNFDRHSLTASAISEKPHRDATPASWSTQEISNATLLGLTAKTMPFRETFKFTRFEFSYFHRQGGNAPDRGPFTNTVTSFFEPRYAFQNAYSFSVFTPIVDAWARSFLFSTRFIYDSVNQGNILITDLFYRPVSSLILNVGADILGSQNPNGADFISRYQANDRLRGGVSYAF